MDVLKDPKEHSVDFSSYYRYILESFTSKREDSFANLIGSFSDDGNCVLEVIECCTSSTRTIPMCFSISSERKHRKRRAAKLIKQKLNAMIGLPERGDIVWRLGLTIRTM